MKIFSDDLRFHWEKIAPLLVIRNEIEYHTAIKRMNELLDEVGANQNHPLYGLLDVLGTLIYAYEEKQLPFLDKELYRASRYVLRKNTKLYKKLSG